MAKALRDFGRTNPALVVKGGVLGNRSLSAAVADRVHEWRSIPLAGGVESLNVAATAAVVAFELARRRRAAG